MKKRRKCLKKIRRKKKTKSKWKHIKEWKIEKTSVTSKKKEWKKKRRKIKERKKERTLNGSIKKKEKKMWKLNATCRINELLNVESQKNGENMQKRWKKSRKKERKKEIYMISQERKKEN